MKRRGEVSAVMVWAFAMTFASTLQAAVSAPDDWPNFRGDTSLTGRARTQLPPTLTPVWTHTAAAGFESSAAIVSGVVYAGSMDGTLVALDAGTGKVRFTYTGGSPIKSSPSVFAGTVYFGDDQGTLHAIDAASGKGLWQFDTGAAIASSAIRVEDRIIFGSNDNNIYGLDTRGARVWAVETGGYVYATPAVIEWQGRPAVVSSGCDGFLRIIRAKDGLVLSKIEIGAYVGASPAILGQRCFLGTYENQVVAVDLLAGKIVWTYENPERQFPFLASAALDERTVFVGGRDKSVHALDAETGRPLWTYETKGRVDASAVLAGNRLFTATTSGELLALDPATGKLLWQFETGSSIVGSPAAGAGRLVIGTTAGTLYAFGAP